MILLENAVIFIFWIMKKSDWQIVLTHPIHYQSEQCSNHCATVMPAKTSSPTCQPPTMHYHALLVKTPFDLSTDTQPTFPSASTLNDIPPDLLVAMEAFHQRAAYCKLLDFIHQVFT